MYFNGMFASSFGRVKVVEWRNSFYTSFDRKEIVSRGIVRASVEVPTIRTIEADLLVRGNSKEEIFLALSRISTWLNEGGTSHLATDRAPNAYYIARCSSISAPVYNGRSAKITATFVCVDHRLYNARTNEPFEVAENDLSNFTFNGKHCLNDMGCIFVPDSRMFIPGVRANKYDIAGRNGTLRYSDGSELLNEGSYSGTLYFVNQTGDGLLSEADITSRIHRVAAWLVNAGRAALILDSDVSRQYEAEIVSETGLSRTNWENGSAKIKFIVQPVCRSVEATSYGDSLSVSPSYLSGLGGAITTDGLGYETPLNITITNTGSNAISDLTLLYQNNLKVKKSIRFNASGFSLAPGETLIISGDDYTISCAGVDGWKYVSSGDLPVVTPWGSKTLEIKSAEATTIDIVVSCYPRWLG